MPSDSELSEAPSIRTNPFTLSQKPPPKPPSSLGIQNRTRHRAQRRPIVESRPKPAQSKQVPRTQNIAPEVSRTGRLLANIPTQIEEVKPSKTPCDNDSFYAQSNPETIDQDITTNSEKDQSPIVEVSTRRARPRTSAIHSQCSVIEENGVCYYKCNHCK